MKKALLPLVITDEDPINKDNSIVCEPCSVAADANSAKCKKPMRVLSGGENIRKDPLTQVIPRLGVNTAGPMNAIAQTVLTGAALSHCLTGLNIQLEAARTVAIEDAADEDAENVERGCTRLFATGLLRCGCLIIVSLRIGHPFIHL